jgi:CBS domain containing-hemolysin-like protein
MLSFIFGLLLMMIMLLAVVCNKIYHQLPVKEVRRLARQKDPASQVIYQAAAYGSSLQALLWIIIALTAAGSFVLFVQALPAWLSFIFILFLLWLGFLWIPSSKPGALSQRLATFTAPGISWLLHYLNAPLEAVSRVIRSKYAHDLHTGIYDHEDMLALLNWQKDQADNRIPVEELIMAENSLTFASKKVGEIVVPRRIVTTVQYDDTIGPILMDELHKSGHSRFPVLEGKPERIVGILHIEDLLNAKEGGRVSTLMRRPVAYVHEDFELGKVLHAFFKTHNHLFVVVNEFEEFVGIITIEDIIKQIIGQPILDEFDNYTDLRAVAAAAAKAEHLKHKKDSSEPVESGDDQDSSAPS